METPEKRSAEEATEKQLRKDTQNKRNDIIVKAAENYQIKEEDIKHIVGLPKIFLR